MLSQRKQDSKGRIHVTLACLTLVVSSTMESRVLRFLALEGYLQWRLG